MNIWTCVSCDTPVPFDVVRAAGGACSLCGTVGFKITETHKIDDICRAYGIRPTEPCGGCGFVSQPKPPWAEHGATFALNGKRYRVVTVGSTNKHTPGHRHTEDSIRCELVEDASWAFPATPCPTSDVGAALRDLFSLPAFRPHELAGAYMIEAHK